MHHRPQFVKCVVCVVAVGGLTSPVKGPFTEPLYISNKPPDSLQFISSSVDYEEEHQESVDKVTTAGRKTKELHDDNEEKVAVSGETKRRSPFCPQTLIPEPNHKRGNKITTVPELELRKLERGEVCFSEGTLHSMFLCCELYSLFSCLFADFYLSSLSQLHSAEMQEQLLSCLSSDSYSTWDLWDKKVTQTSTESTSLIYFTPHKTQTVGVRLITGK